jgi:intracellular sulfur oxidation DsrE/DsrF family protein
MARLGAGIAAFTGASAMAAHSAAAMPSASGPWEPVRHPQDDWFDQLPGKHRFFFDAASPTGAGEALQFSSNFLYASKIGYQLGDDDNAVVICLRHWATCFAFSDAIWAKYGAMFTERSKFVDPKTNAAPVINVYLTKGYGMLLSNRDNTFQDAISHKIHFAVCDMATHALAGQVAGKMGLKSDDVYAELKAAAHLNSHFVPAGIVAVNRAQERGYAIQHAG